MNARGQGTVELALGATIVVSILLLGLYLVETSFLSLKVQEASAAAVWDATGRPVNDFRKAAAAPGTIDKPYQQTLSGPASTEKAITQRYRDFDALNKGSNGTRRLFARGSGMDVACERTGRAANDPVAFNVPRSPLYEDGSARVPSRVTNLLRDWYKPEGGTVCTATASVRGFDLPKTFLDKSEGGYFSKFRDNTAIKLCGAGRAVAGDCKAGYAVLLGDWGLDGAPGQDIVRDSPLPESMYQKGVVENKPYRAMVRDLFEESGSRYDANGTSPGAAARFAMRIGGRLSGSKYPAPVNEKTFYMSYAGSEHDYVDALSGPTMAEASASCATSGCNPKSCMNCHFNTAGTQTVNGNPKPAPKNDWAELRRPCFLGIDGCTVP